MAEKLSQEIDERKADVSKLKVGIAGSKFWMGILIAIGGGRFTLGVAWILGLLKVK